MTAIAGFKHAGVHDGLTHRRDFNILEAIPILAERSPFFREPLPPILVDEFIALLLPRSVRTLSRRAQPDPREEQIVLL
jgi:hypothetical protein